MKNQSLDFQQDWDQRINPELMTALLSEAVPCIKDVEFKYTSVDKGYCKALLPLNAKSSNQHGTHQALILAMAGDYTGGLALASLITHEPILGVHEISKEKGMSLWLIKSDMQYLKPSTDDVFVEAIIPEEREATLINRYHEGKTILLDVDVSFKNGRDEDVATGRFRYYCKKKNALANTAQGKPINAMFEHVLKTSAKLIAQLRAMEGDKENPLFTDELSRRVAGKQGKIIADRFIPMLPELQNMVAARTWHLNQTIKRMSGVIKNIVFVGAGLDFRLYNDDYMKLEAMIYELDLKEMIAERQKQEELMGLKNRFLPPPVKIGCNFILDNIAEKLLEHNFDPKQPGLFIFEGCSMYFSEEENKKIMGEISVLLDQNENSILWMDTVSEKALDKNNTSEGVSQFLANIAALGEPFIYGFDDHHSLMGKLAMKKIESKYTYDLMDCESSDTYDLYSFHLFGNRKSNL